jgi:hypothetical protein
MDEESIPAGATRPIMFTRPDPTRFALLVTKTGRGTGTVVGTENFKPSGCEWATEQDLRDAGYVPADDVRKIAELFVMAIESGATTREQVVNLLGDRMEAFLRGA